ncbi:MAG: ATP synthase F1 subunit epsilon [Bacteroidia bacterium]|nr:ATP synthase F1 subunit epsilon [Bacteroidia bacterium]
MKTFQLEIVTPEASVFAGPVQRVSVPGSQGGFQVLYNHAPIISTLTNGRVKVVTESGETRSYSTREGVIEVLNNKAVILVEKILD